MSCNLEKAGGAGIERAPSARRGARDARRARPLGHGAPAEISPALFAPAANLRALPPPPDHRPI